MVHTEINYLKRLLRLWANGTASPEMIREAVKLSREWYEFQKRKITAAVTFPSEAAAQKCLTDPTWVAQMNRLVNHAYHRL